LVKATVDIVRWYCVLMEIIVVTATVDIVQWYCVVCGVYCHNINSRYSAMLLCCVWRLLWIKQQSIWQWYCVVLEFIVVTATVDIVQCYCVVLEFIVVTATVVLVQCY